jgi:hypothetical protein
MRGHLRERGNALEIRINVGIGPRTNRRKYLTRTFCGCERETEEALVCFVAEVSGGGQARRTRALATSSATGGRWSAASYHRRRSAATSGSSPTTSRRSAAGCRWHGLGRRNWDGFYGQLREDGGRDGKPLVAAIVRREGIDDDRV